MDVTIEPLAHLAAQRDPRVLAFSARPDSPVVADAVRESRHLVAVRDAVAAGLQTLAAKVEPRRAPCTLAPGR